MITLQHYKTLDAVSLSVMGQLARKNKATHKNRYTHKLQRAQQHQCVTPHIPPPFLQRGRERNERRSAVAHSYTQNQRPRLSLSLKEVVVACYAPFNDRKLHIIFQVYYMDELVIFSCGVMYTAVLHTSTFRHQSMTLL